MISIKDLTYRYAGTDDDVLKDVTLDFVEGSFTAIMGANGSGKSTLARCLSGFLQPTKGGVLVDGLSTQTPDSLLHIRRKIGFVFQDPNLQMTSATVERELAFGLQNFGIPRGEIKEKVERELHHRNLWNMRHVPPSSLSGGETQRLALASVLLLEPQYLILDEPTSFLSASSRKRILNELLELHRLKNTTIVLVTQFFEEASVAERLVVLDTGRIAADKDPQESLHDLRKLESYGIAVPANLKMIV